MAINLMRKLYIKVNKKKIIIFCLIFILFVCKYAFAYRASVRDKSCFSNIRVIQGAIEMYNMDISDRIEHIEPDTINRLVKGKYLKTEPSKPETTCEYKSIGDLTEGGFVFCTYHGDPEQIIECEYCKNDEFHQYRKIPQNATEKDLKKANIPEIIKERDRFREKRDIILKEKAEKKAKQKLIELYVPLIAVVLTLIVGVIIDISNYIKSKKRTKKER